MARVTVEDCLEQVDNRFALVMRASRRARQLHRGAEALLAKEDDKSTVLALREIADGLITDELLEASDIPLEEEQPTVVPIGFGDLGDDRDDFD